jgi:hypothetical protein
MLPGTLPISSVLWRTKPGAAAWDGVICGHIHRAQLVMMGQVLSCNDGDWVESCTTLIEDTAGQLSLLRWTETRELLLRSAAPVVAALDRAA